MVSILGIDEAGRGPVIGSMFIAGCLFEEKDIGKLKEINVKDSKLLTHSKRIRLQKQIREIAKKIKIIQIKPKEIDEALESDSLNLNWLEAIKQAMIINELKPDKVIIDCPSPNIRAYKEYLMVYIKDKNINIICEHKADRGFIECSSASIIAKCAREEEIETLKKKIGKDFGSLYFNEDVLIEHNRRLSLEKIGTLVEEGPWNIKVFSLDTNSLCIKKYNVTDFIENPRVKIFKIELERGKEIKLSKNHPVFCLDDNLEIKPKKISELKIGDKIAVCGKFDNRSNLKYIDIAGLLYKNSTKESPLYVKINKCFINKNHRKIKELQNYQGYKRTSYYNWLRNSYLPLNIFYNLNCKLNVKICSREDKIRISRYFGINKEVMWLLGIFIAEGYLNKHSVLISNNNQKTIQRIKDIAKKYRLSYTHNIKHNYITLNSVLLVKIFKNLVKGNNAYDKQIPEFVFSTNKTMIKELLNGLYLGDGYIKTKSENWEIELRSEKIIKQIQWLNLMLGNFCAYKKRTDKPAFISGIMSKSTNSLSPDNLPNIIGIYINKLRRSKNISISELSKKTEISRNVLKCIECMKVNSVQKKTIKRILKIIPDKKLNKLINSDICWLGIKKIKYIDTDKVYDLGVAYKNTQNFLGGTTGIILHNSGYLADPKTKKFFEENWEKHPEIFRKTWTPYKNNINGKNQKKLDEF